MLTICYCCYFFTINFNINVIGIKNQIGLFEPLDLSDIEKPDEEKTDEEKSDEEKSDEEKPDEEEPDDEELEDEDEIDDEEEIDDELPKVKLKFVSMVMSQCFHCVAWVQFLVKEVRSHKLCGIARKN